MLFFTRMNALSCKAFIITEFYFMNISCFERGFCSCIKHKHSHSYPDTKKKHSADKKEAVLHIQEMPQSSRRQL